MNLTKKRLSLSALALLGALPLTTMAAAPLPTEGMYVNGFGGFTWLPSNDAKTGATLTYKNNFTSYNFGGALGYKSGPMRYEGQFIYLRGRHNKFAGTSVSGGTNVFAGMANVYFDFDMINFDIVPYVGAGIGYGYNINSRLG